MMRTGARVVSWAALVAPLLVPTAAGAFELSGGVSVGGMLAGTLPQLALSPNAAIAWRAESGFMLAAHNAFNILPATNDGLGVYNQTSFSLGYASEDVRFSTGPSLSIYSMTACGVYLCGRVLGLAPGWNAQTSWFFSGPLGLSLSANVNWIGGSSLVLRGGVAAMVVAGPVFRWSSK